MAEYTVAQAALAIVPSFAGFQDAINSEAQKAGDSAGGIFSETFNERVSSGTAGALGEQDEDAAEKGEAAGGAFSDAFKARVEAALAALPDVRIDADTSETDQKIAQIRSDLEILSNKTIGIDISDDEALARLTVLKAELEDISHSSESIQVRVDTGQAAAELGILSLEADTTGGSLGGIGSGASSAGFEIGSLLVPALVALGAALVPVAGVALGGLAALPAIFAGLGGGITAIVLAAPAIEKLATTTFDPLVKSLRPLVDDAILPGISAALKDIVPLFQALSPFVVTAASDLGSLAQQFGEFLGSSTVISQLSSIFNAGTFFMQQMGEAAVTLFGAFISAGAQAAPIIIPPLVKGITDIVNAFAHWVSDGGFQKFLVWLQENGPTVVNAVKNLLEGIGKLLVALAPVGLAIDNLLNALGLFIQLIAQGLTDAIEYLENHWLSAWTDIHDIVNTVWHAIDNDVFQPLENFFTVDLPGALNGAVGFFKAFPGNIVTALGDVVSTITAPFKSFAGWVNTNVVQPVVTFFTALPGQIVTALGDVLDTITAPFKAVASWVNTNVLQPVIGLFKALPGDISSSIGDLTSIGKKIISDIAAGVGDVASWASGIFSDLGKDILNGIGDLTSIGKDIINAIIGGIDKGIDEINSHIPSVFGIKIFPSLPDIPKLATGGIVPATPGGTLAILGEAGVDEAVIPVNQFSQYIIPSNHLPASLVAAGGSSGDINFNVASVATVADVQSILMGATFLRKSRRL